MTGEPRPAVRVLALLFSVMATGGLIGFGWERLTYEEIPEDPMERVPAEEMRAARSGRTPGDEALLQRALSHFPPYPRGSRPEVLAADYLGSDVPIAVAWFSTEDPPDRVLSHYRGTLLDAGLPALSEHHGEHAGYVGYWSPSTEEVHLVSTLAQGGETLVFVSSGRMAPLLEGPAKVPEWIPLPVETEDALALTFSLEGATQHVVSGRVPRSTVPEVVELFLRSFGERGWSVEATHPARDAIAELEVRRGGVRGLVMVRRTLPAQEVDIYLSLTERMRSPDEESEEEASR